MGSCVGESYHSKKPAGYGPDEHKELRRDATTHRAIIIGGPVGGALGGTIGTVAAVLAG